MGMPVTMVAPKTWQRFHGIGPRRTCSCGCSWGPRCSGWRAPRESLQRLLRRQRGTSRRSRRRLRRSRCRRGGTRRRRRRRRRGRRDRRYRLAGTFLTAIFSLLCVRLCSGREASSPPFVAVFDCRLLRLNRRWPCAGAYALCANANRVNIYNVNRAGNSLITVRC
jgi:hypothetical protein